VCGPTVAVPEQTSVLVLTLLPIFFYTVPFVLWGVVGVH
jgi:hypothetical protein